MKPLIGITVGDQAGIGLEIINKAISNPEIKNLADFWVIGDIISRPVYGRVNSEYGKIAGDAIIQAVRLAREDKIDAIVTAPINKEALNAGGFNYTGHTEMIAALCGVREPRMMLVYGDLRVIHTTTHCSLREALNRITNRSVLETIEVAAEGCRQLGIPQPYLGVCALNPHGSDGGLFGNEEYSIIQPAIENAIEKGLEVHKKPIPSDIAFAKASGGAYDCIIAMYHDQGHIPVKTLGFHWDNVAGEWDKIDGVNITFGLPIIRASPDHGVAFGKAGKGIADPTSMLSAIKLAVQLIKTRRKNA